MWDKVGMARNAKGLNDAINEIAYGEEFYKDVKYQVQIKDSTRIRKKATRVADFLELGELFTGDATP
jgi:succinate dehydrogenase / fumarate reductase flavoprotein subunit